MRIHCEHRMPFAADHFWAIIHAPEYESLVAESLGLAEYREVERREEPEAIYRRIEARPSALSESFQKLLQRIAGVGSANYVEEQWRSKHAMEVRWQAIPSVLNERVRVEGVVRIEPIDEQTCLRILEGEVAIRVPVLGGMLERAAASAVVESYGKSAKLARAEDFPRP
jgi:hypothetical protein